MVFYPIKCRRKQHLTLYQTTKPLTKLKAFADDKFNVAEMLISLFYMVEKIVVKRENAGHQHLHIFPQCFQKATFKSRDCVVNSLAMFVDCIRFQIGPVHYFVIQIKSLPNDKF